MAIKYSIWNSWSETLAQGFKGRAVPVPTSVWQAHTAQSLQLQVQEDLANIHGPFYRGEAEAHLLYPLLEMAALASSPDYTPGRVTQQAYSVSSIYACIYQVVKSLNFKEAQEQLSRDAVMRSPIFTATQEFSAAEQGVSSPDGKFSWPLFWARLNGEVTDYNQSGSQLLYTLLMDPANADPNKGVMEIDKVYKRVTRYLHMGHGQPVAPTDANLQHYTAIFNGVLTAVEKIGALVAADASSSAALSDLFVIVTLTHEYIHQIAEYDVFWSSAALPSTRDAIPSAIKSLCSKMAATYLSAATMGLSYDLSIARSQWEDLTEFLSEALPDTAEVSDMRKLWGDRVAKPLDSLVHPLIVSTVATTKAALVQWTQATTILRPDWVPQIDGLLHSIPVPVDAVPTPDQILFAANVVKDSDHAFQAIGRPTVLLPTLQEFASIISDLVQGLTAMYELVSAGQTGTILQSKCSLDSLPSITPEGSIDHPAWESFNLPAPYEPVISPWVSDSAANLDDPASNNIRTWRFKDYLFKPAVEVPFFYNNVATGQQFYWVPRAEITIGTPSTAPFYSQPIPDCYTRDRLASSLPFSYEGFEQAIRCQSTIAPTARDYFQNAANLIVAYPKTQGASVLDALASTFAVTVREGDGEPEYKAPRIAFTYGAPTPWLHQANLQLIRAQRAKGMPCSWSVTVDSVTPMGVSYSVTFTALLMYPAPTPTVYRLSPSGRMQSTLMPVSRDRCAASLPASLTLESGPGKGYESYSTTTTGSNHIEVHYSSFADATYSAADITTAYEEALLMLSQDKGRPGDAEAIAEHALVMGWVLTRGYSPFLLSLPSSAVVGVDREANMNSLFTKEDLIRLAMCTVSKKWRPLSRRYDLGVIINRSILVYTVDDYNEFISGYSCDYPGRTKVDPEPEEHQRDTAGGSPAVPSILPVTPSGMSASTQSASAAAMGTVSAIQPPVPASTLPVAPAVGAPGTTNDPISPEYTATRDTTVDPAKIASQTVEPDLMSGEPASSGDDQQPEKELSEGRDGGTKASSVTARTPDSEEDADDKKKKKKQRSSETEGDPE